MATYLDYIQFFTITNNTTVLFFGLSSANYIRISEEKISRGEISESMIIIFGGF